MKNVIGLLGVKGAGKDTAAEHLQKHHGYVRVAFADRLYQEVAGAFGVATGFLGKRETKELDLPELALRHCRDQDFVDCVRDELGSAASDSTFLDAPRSPRFVLQLWGTEYRRKRGVDSYWLDIVTGILAAHPDRRHVITDVRFINEARLITAHGGSLVRIRRTALEAQAAISRAANGTSAHPSETELLTYPVQAELLNVEGAPESLGEGLENFLAAQSNVA